MKNVKELNEGTTQLIDIVDLTQQGQGIGKLNGMIIFVDDTVPGDQIVVEIEKVKSHYAVGKLLRIKKKSEHRTQPTCPYDEACGGCQLGHIKYESQLAFKQKYVVDALTRIGGIEDADQHVCRIQGMENPKHYRNKAQYKVCSAGVGFYRKNSHDIIPIVDCQNQNGNSKAVIAATRMMIKEQLTTIYNETTKKGELRGVIQRSNRAGEEMVILVLNQSQNKGNKKVNRIIEIFTKCIPELKSLNINYNTSRGNIIMGSKTDCIWGIPYIEETLDDLSFVISPRSFFQVNTQQTEVLYQTVARLAGVDDSQTVFDLFCGTGTISLFLAKQAKAVYGIEVIPEAIEDAKENAIRNGVTNAEFICGKAENALPQLIKDGIKADIVVVDPPRKGIEASIVEAIADIKVRKLVYVSCNPATLARDLALFNKESYRIETIQPIDLFPGTGHVETVALLSQQK